MAAFNESDANLILRGDEALVLFELLSRWLMDQPEEAALTFVDESESVVLSTILAQLEKHLVSPFRSDYRELVAAARKDTADRG